MSDLPAMLEWKYGSVADTAGNRIIHWRHPTIPQPDAAQIASDLVEYTAHLAAADRKRPTLTRIVDALLLKGVFTKNDI